jgi:hypothetical protein
MSNVNFLSSIVIFFDLASIVFLTWRIFDKKATLWGIAKGIYGWIVLTLLYHVTVYIASLFNPAPLVLINNLLHPVVLFFVINPTLVAIIHWRGGKFL